MVGTAAISLSNPVGVFYVRGSEQINGSIRVCSTVIDSVAVIEARDRGVWNDTGLRLSATSVEVGRDLTLSAVAGFIETTNPSEIVGHARGLVPHIQLTETGTKQLRTPILKPLESLEVFSVADSEVIGTAIGVTFTPDLTQAIRRVIHETGSVPATEEVEVSFYLGTDNTGLLFNRRLLPASDFPANSALVINYEGALGFAADSAVFVEFVSTAPFSFKVDAETRMLTTHICNELGELGVFTENIIYDNNLNHILDLNLNPVYGDQF